jgi:hypothetical protein
MSYRPTRAIQVATYLADRQGRWVPGNEISNPTIGGSDGRRRARELREYGFHVECRPMDGREEWEYRLTGYDPV